jgi:2-dehydropantoate 2-reductase
MNICIIGAGAVGGSLAVRLAKAGNAVSLVARGEHAAAIHCNGLTLLCDDSRDNIRIPLSVDGSDLPPPDAVIVAVKSHALASTIPALLRLAREDTPVVFALNGVPWWYPYSRQAIGAAERRLDLSFLDPAGVLIKQIGSRRVLGAVAYSASQLVAPGVVQAFSVDHSRFIVGEIDGCVSDRGMRLVEALSKTDIDASIVADIESAVWRKLVTNVAQSPICCLTRKPMAVLGHSPSLLRIAKALMAEVASIAAAWGSELGINVDTHFGSRSLASAHKPSMLQDLETGRRPELDSLIVAVQVCAKARNVETPVLDLLAPLMVGLFSDPHAISPATAASMNLRTAPKAAIARS